MTKRPNPSGFITAAEAAQRHGCSVRTMTERCLLHGIAIRVARPGGGVEWSVYEPARRALQRNDTGTLADEQRYLQNYTVG
jgi:hypothetical protein